MGFIEISDYFEIMMWYIVILKCINRFDIMQWYFVECNHYGLCSVWRSNFLAEFLKNSK